MKTSEGNEITEWLIAENGHQTNGNHVKHVTENQFQRSNTAEFPNEETEE